MRTFVGADGTVVEVPSLIVTVRPATVNVPLREDELVLADTR